MKKHRIRSLGIEPLASHATDEAETAPLRFEFEGSVKLVFSGSSINPKQHERIDWLTRRHPSRPPNHAVCRYTSFHYRAKSWSKPCRIVAMVAFHPDEFFPNVGFVVTNRSLPNEWVLAFYNDRGTAEKHNQEGNCALKWTRLSWLRFAANAVRL